MTTTLTAHRRATTADDQATYAADVAARGLTALLAPYTLAGRLPRIPRQRLRRR